MAWVKLDDGFFLHPKAIAAGRDARDVYLAALCWSNQQMTDGVIPAHTLPLIAALAGVADYDAAASKLVEVQLWHNHVEGWEVHGFLERQQAREQREEWLQRDRERKKAARDARKAQQVPEIVQPESERNPDGFQTMSALEKSKSKSKSSSTTNSPLVPLTGTPFGSETDGSIRTATTDQRITATFDAWLSRQAATQGIPEGKRRQGYIQQAQRTIDQHWPALKALAKANPTATPDELADLYRRKP
jgi:hypothetical protein